MTPAAPDKRCVAHANLAPDVIHNLTPNHFFRARSGAAKRPRIASEQCALPLAADRLKAVGRVGDGVGLARNASAGSRVKNARAALATAELRGWDAPVVGAVQHGLHSGALRQLYVAARPRCLAGVAASARAGRALGA
jgi:hypothetical protein